ncbi:MAG: oligosaccharide flippase family protein [Gammaproteobacteria bacterium]|nr:oligosaccharide flippase family protein [Gammaproteobacteria bacterium]
MTQFRRSIVQATVARYLGMVISFGSNMVLARLLLPEEVGVFSIGAAVVALLAVLRDFGVTRYLIREAELTQSKLDTCFGFSLAIAWAFGVALLLGAPRIATLYRSPGLEAVLYILAAGLFVVPFNSIRLALLRREMRFDVLLRAELASALANAVVSIVLAFLGYRYLALAWGTFASIVATVLVARLAPVSASPGWPSLADWRSVANFGGLSLAMNLIIRLGTRAPELIVGRTLGMHDTGILSRANGMTELFNTLVLQSTGQVAFAEISRKFRAGLALDDDYRNAVTYVAVLSQPFFGFIILLALPVTRAVSGNNWDAAAGLLQWLAITGFAIPFSSFGGAFLTAVGRIDLQLRIEAITTPIKISAWLLAAPCGLLFATQVYVMFNLLTSLWTFRVVSRLLGVDEWQTARGALRAVPVSVLALCAPALAQWLELEARIGAVATVMASGVLMGVLWLAGLFAFRHPFADELRHTVSEARSHWRKGRKD